LFQERSWIAFYLRQKLYYAKKPPRKPAQPAFGTQNRSWWIMSTMLMVRSQSLGSRRLLSLNFLLKNNYRVDGGKRVLLLLE